MHSDVCGLMQVPTMSGNRYFLTFIDDCSRMCWIYLRNKSDVFYLQEIQGHGGITKWLLSEKAEDRIEVGSSFQMNSLDCVSLGLERQLTVAYTPQQNGVVWKEQNNN